MPLSSLPVYVLCTSQYQNLSFFFFLFFLVSFCVGYFVFHITYICVYSTLDFFLGGGWKFELLHCRKLAAARVVVSSVVNFCPPSVCGISAEFCGISAEFCHGSSLWDYMYFVDDFDCLWVCKMCEFITYEISCFLTLKDPLS